MLKVETEEVMGVAQAMLSQARSTAKTMSSYGVAQVKGEHDDPQEDGMWFIIKAKKDDVCRVGDCFMFAIDGAGDAFETMAKKMGLDQPKTKPKTRRIEVQDGK